MILCVSLNSLACHLLIRCKEMLEHMPEVLWEQPKARDSYGMIAQVCLGKAGTVLVDSSILITLFGAAALYQVTVSALLVQVYPPIDQRFYVLICAGILLPFIFLRNIGYLAYVSGVAVVAYILAFFVIYGYGSHTHAFRLDSEQLLSFPLDPISLTQGFGVVSFSLGVPILCFTLQESMSRPKQFLPALDGTLLAVAIGYVLVGVIGVGLFGRQQILGEPRDASVQFHGVNPIVLTNLPVDSVVGLVVKSVIALVLLLTSPLTFVPALGLLENIVFGQQQGEEGRGRVTRRRRKSFEQQPPGGARAQRERENEETIPINERGSLTGGATQYRTEEWKAEESGDEPATTPDPSLSTQHSPSADTGEVLIHSTLPSPSFSIAPQSYHLQLFVRSLLRLSLLALVVSLAVFVPCFTLLMSLIGCVTLNILSFILPPLFYMRIRHLRRRRGRFDFSEAFISDTTYALQMAGCAGFLAFGVISLVATTWLTVTQGRCE